MCGRGKRIARSWYRSAGKPDRITAHHVFKVLKSRHRKCYPVHWGYILDIISKLLTTHQIKRVIRATKGKPKRALYCRRNYDSKPDFWLARSLLNSMYKADRIKVLEYA